LFLKEHIDLQQHGYDLLVEEVDKKRAEIVCVKVDIKELNDELVAKNEPIKSNFEIEALRKEIRALTNEKARLEHLISKSKSILIGKGYLKNA
jgi:hypothetical protein